MRYRFRIVLLLMLAGIFLAKLNSVNSALLNEENRNVIKQDTNLDPGKTVYLSHCMSCHQKDGSGVQNMYPSLKNSEWVNGDKSRLINIVLKGLKGTITVNGETYNGDMPRQDYLTDQQIADLLTFLRKNFENNAGAVLPEDVLKLRK